MMLFSRVILIALFLLASFVTYNHASITNEIGDDEKKEPTKNNAGGRTSGNNLFRQTGQGTYVVRVLALADKSFVSCDLVGYIMGGQIRCHNEDYDFQGGLLAKGKSCSGKYCLKKTHDYTKVTGNITRKCDVDNECRKNGCDSGEFADIPGFPKGWKWTVCCCDTDLCNVGHGVSAEKIKVWAVMIGGIFVAGWIFY